MNEEIFRLKDVFIIIGISMIYIAVMPIWYENKINELNDDVEYYKTMYNEKDIAVKILQESCGVE